MPGKPTTSKQIDKSKIYEELCKLSIAEKFGISPNEIRTLEGKQRVAGLALPRAAPPLHQIDLDWEVETDVTRVKFFADAKLHDRPLEKGYVDKLFGVLQSTDYHKAMLISPVGFTQGAIDVADAHGIALLVVPADAEALAFSAYTRDEVRTQLAELACVRPELRTNFTVIRKSFVPTLDHKVTTGSNLTVSQPSFQNQIVTKVVGQSGATQQGGGFQHKAFGVGSGPSSGGGAAGPGQGGVGSPGGQGAGGGPSRGGAGGSGYITKGGGGFGGMRRK